MPLRVPRRPRRPRAPTEHRPIYRWKKDDYVVLRGGILPEKCHERDLPEGFWEKHCSPIFNRRRDAERVWEREADAAISRGQLSVAQANKLSTAGRKMTKHEADAAISRGQLSVAQANELSHYGGRYKSCGEARWGESEDGCVELLPTPLYHATVAKSRILREGLRIPRSISKTAAHVPKGLGGSSSDRISLTTDPEYARNVQWALLEARALARGEFGLPEMIEAAAKGEGAYRPYLAYFLSWWNRKWKEGDPLPLGLRLRLKGRELVSHMDVPIGGFTLAQAKARGLEPVEGGGCWKDAKGRARCSTFSRKLSPKRRRSIDYDGFSWFLTARGEAGGISNPVFMGTNLSRLARIPGSEIATLRLEPCPSAKGEWIPGEDEYRIADGRAVRVTHVNGKRVSTRSKVAHCRSGVYSGPTPRRLHYLYLPISKERLQDAGHILGPKSEYRDTLQLTDNLQLARDLAYAKATNDGKWEGKAVVLRVPVAERDLRAVSMYDDPWLHPPAAVLDRWMRKPWAAEACRYEMEDAGVDTPTQLSPEDQRACWRENMRRSRMYSGDDYYSEGWEYPADDKDWKTSLKYIGMAETTASFKGWGRHVREVWKAEPGRNAPDVPTYYRIRADEE